MFIARGNFISQHRSHCHSVTLISTVISTFSIPINITWIFADPKSSGYAALKHWFEILQLQVALRKWTSIHLDRVSAILHRLIYPIENPRIIRYNVHLKVIR